MRFFAISVNSIAFLRHFSWEAASAGAWNPIARRRRIFGWPSCDCMAASPKLQLETVFECGVGECSAHVADAQPLASYRTGCRTGDPPCLDLDLRSRDAPAPAAPRWRKTHRGRCSAPLATRDFVARGGGAELCGSGTWQWHFVQNRFSSARVRVSGGALRGFWPFECSPCTQLRRRTS